MTDRPTAVSQDHGTSSSTADLASDGGRELEAQPAGSRGVTTIRDSVVAKIASIAAREVRGVADLGGTAESAIGGVMDRLRGDEHSTAGVGVEVGERQAAVDIAMRVEYPARIQEVARSVRENVIDQVETMTGLDVVEVNVGVVDLAFPGDEDADESQEQRVE